jgi:hypothetical protein
MRLPKIYLRLFRIDRARRCAPGVCLPASLSYGLQLRIEGTIEIVVVILPITLKASLHELADIR